MRNVILAKAPDNGEEMQLRIQSTQIPPYTVRFQDVVGFEEAGRSRKRAGVRARDNPLNATLRPSPAFPCVTYLMKHRLTEARL